MPNISLNKSLSTRACGLQKEYLTLPYPSLYKRAGNLDFGVQMPNICLY